MASVGADILTGLALVAALFGYFFVALGIKAGAYQSDPRLFWFLVFIAGLGTVYLVYDERKKATARSRETPLKPKGVVFFDTADQKRGP